MIPATTITAWGSTRPWPTRAQIEQDLLLSRVLIAIASHSYLGEELAFRGGTALHKLHLPQPFRYSEDLDFVRSTAGGIKELIVALTGLGDDLGFETSTRMSRQPKVYYRTRSDDGIAIRIKVEINTYERSPAQPHVRMRHAVNSSWWSGAADVRTFAPPELVATKIRALYQRSKGRDLFDLWLALTELGLEPDAILGSFGPYRPDGMSSALSIVNLRAKLNDPRFRDDLDTLVANLPASYNIEAAAELIIESLLGKL